jgi:hypothetical protein
MRRTRYLLVRLSLLVFIAVLTLVMATPANARSSTRATKFCNERLYIGSWTLLEPNTICLPLG